MAMNASETRGFLVCLASPFCAMDQNGKGYSQAVQCLNLLRRVADVVELASTNSRAARSEWAGAGLPVCDVLPIRRRELSACLTELMNRGYEGRYTLMIGGGQQALQAARQNHAFFFPILPGHEEACWNDLAEEGMQKLLHGTFAGAYQQRLIACHNSVFRDE